MKKIFSKIFSMLVGLCFLSFLIFPSPALAGEGETNPSWEQVENFLLLQAPIGSNIYLWVSLDEEAILIGGGDDPKTIWVYHMQRENKQWKVKATCTFGYFHTEKNSYKKCRMALMNWYERIVLLPNLDMKIYRCNGPSLKQSLEEEGCVNTTIR